MLAYGENCIRAHHTLERSIHAEHRAILNLPSLPRKHHCKKVDILVIRTSKTGILGMSKPCVHCLSIMKSLAPEKGYRINKISYTDETGSIIDTSLNKLLLEDTKFMSSYYRNSHCKFSL